MSITTQIIDAIAAIVTNNVTGINYISFDKIKLAIADFEAHELPAIQIWDGGTVVTHERGRVRKSWNISLELIMKSDIAGVVDQKALLEKLRELELALWENPNLNIPGVIHMVYTGNISDLHLLEPFYIARLDLTVMFYDSLTGSC